MRGGGEGLGYTPVLLTDCLCCQAKEAGSFLASIVKSHVGQGRKMAFIAGGDTATELRAHGLTVDAVLKENDAYHALQKTGGLIITGATGTNVNDVAVALLRA